MKSIDQIKQYLTHRLIQQQGDKSKIARQYLRNEARRGNLTLPSGFGVTISAAQLTLIR